MVQPESPHNGEFYKLWWLIMFRVTYNVLIFNVGDQVNQIVSEGNRNQCIKKSRGYRTYLTKKLKFACLINLTARFMDYTILQKK